MEFFIFIFTETTIFVLYLADKKNNINKHVKIHMSQDKDRTNRINVQLNNQKIILYTVVH